jgi:WD40 repeat protein
LVTLEGHTGTVTAVAVSGDGKLVASGSFDGTVRLWESRSGASLRTLRPERRYERMDITGLTGITKAQRQALVALGGVDRSDGSEWLFGRPASNLLMPDVSPVRHLVPADPGRLEKPGARQLSLLRRRTFLR